MNQVIIRPHITEKTMGLAGKGLFTFIVNEAASKNTVRAAVESMYKVEVVEVSTVMVRGKMRRVGRSGKSFRTPDLKKAIVEVKKGQTIDAFEITGQQGA